MNKEKWSATLSTYRRAFGAFGIIHFEDETLHRIALEAAINAYNDSTEQSIIRTDTTTFVLQSNHYVKKIGDLLVIHPEAPKLPEQI